MALLIQPVHIFNFHINDNKHIIFSFSLSKYFKKITTTSLLRNLEEKGNNNYE